MTRRTIIFSFFSRLLIGCFSPALTNQESGVSQIQICKGREIVHITWNFFYNISQWARKFWKVPRSKILILNYSIISENKNDLPLSKIPWNYLYHIISRIFFIIFFSLYNIQDMNAMTDDFPSSRVNVWTLRSPGPYRIGSGPQLTVY